VTVADLHVEGVDEDHRIDRSSGLFCHSVISSRTLSAIREIASLPWPHTPTSATRSVGLRPVSYLALI
jgi:hypothetical protein